MQLLPIQWRIRGGGAVTPTLLWIRTVMYKTNKKQDVHQLSF